jgi:NADPH:quinone reductase-like Zn-dependent oxidoreductase
MRAYRFDAFGIENLKLKEVTDPVPSPGEVRLNVAALSLNFRDVLVVRGLYNPKLKLPATPISDGAGTISAVGEGVESLRPGDRVMSHFISGWLDGPFRQEYVATTLGLPFDGLAAEQVVLPAHAVLPIPDGYDFAQAATLPIAALTAWSALRTVTHVERGQTVLTLGTGGVSIFALQLAKAMGAQVIITSSSDEKLERARALGAIHTINYAKTPNWERAVLEFTDGHGAHVTVENVGAATLNQSLRATRAGGTIALLGALKNLEGDVNTGMILMKRLRICGIMVDSRAAFADLCRFLTERKIEPVISARFRFEQLPEAFRHMESGEHFGKIVVDVT